VRIYIYFAIKTAGGTPAGREKIRMKLELKYCILLLILILVGCNESKKPIEDLTSFDHTIVIIL